MRNNDDFPTRSRQWGRSGFGLGVVSLLMIVGYFLLTEHRAHAIQILPSMLVGGLVVLCLGMHLLMHRGHGGHGGNGGQGRGGKEHDHVR
jgi:hypothetical protein